MGDSGSRPKKPQSVLKSIVGVGLQKPQLRDEIFCQICKQTRNNPDPISLVEGWKIFAICVSAFSPTRGFQDYLLNYFIDNYEGPNEVKILAPYCYYRLNKTIAHGPEAKALSLDEIKAIVRAGGPRSYQVLFGGHLEYILSLQKAEGMDLEVPEMLPIIFNAIKKKGGFQTKGIFRIAADTVQVKNLISQFSRGDYEVKTDDPNVPADVLKVWLRDLSEPIIPAHLYEICLKASESQEKSAQLVQDLPKAQCDTINFLLNFLAELASNQSATSMSAENLAIVFAPNLIRSEEKDPRVILKNSQRMQNFVRNLIWEWTKKIKNF